MTEFPIDEITRILATWPEGDHLAGVLRVVRAMQERVDLAEELTARVWRAASEHDAECGCWVCDAWDRYTAKGQGPERERQLALPPGPGACVTPAHSPLLALAEEILAAWHDHRKCVSVEGERIALDRIDRAIAAYDAARGTATHPEPDREERADTEPPHPEAMPPAKEEA